MTHGRETGPSGDEAPRGDAHHEHGTAPAGEGQPGGTAGGERLSAELRALLEALGAWAEPRAGQGGSPDAQDSATGQDSSAGQDSATGPDGEGESGTGECSWCPLCALAGLLRQRHPELLVQLAEALRVLRTAVAERISEDATTAGAAEADTGAAAAACPADSAGAEPTSKAERITVRRVDGPVTAAESSASGRET